MPVGGGWLPATSNRGAVVLELAADFVATVGQGMAAFLAVPAHVTVFGSAAADGARRGTPSGALGLGQRLQFPLEGSGLDAHLALDAFGDEAMRLEVSLSGPVSGPMSAQVFVCENDDLELLGAEPLGAHVAATFRGIPPGRYVVDIHEQAQQRRFRLRLVVQSQS